MIRISLLQQVKSLFYPVLVRRGSSIINPVLELYFFRGRYQLATADVLYSDGDKYRPLLSAFRAMREDFERIKRVLVLGTGLGSAVHVSYSLGFKPHFTLVDLDQTVLDWATELMQTDMRNNVSAVCANAATYISSARDNYDLIVVDIFIGREVPPFATTPEFLKQCKDRLAPGGKLVYNYMVRGRNEEGAARPALLSVMRKVEELAFGLNKVYIAS